MKKVNPSCPPSEPSQPLLVALGCSVVALVPFLLGQFDSVLWTVWVAVISLPTGAFAGACRLKAWPFGLAIPGTWMVILAWLEVSSGGTLPEPAWGAAAWSGLFVVGMALGALVGSNAFRCAAGGLVLTVLSSALPVSGAPSLGLYGGRSLGQVAPSAAAAAFDTSPITLVMESAGVDWMRHRAVYDSAGTEWFSDRRKPYRGKLAASLILLVGYLGILLSRSRARAIWGSQERSA